VIVDPLASLDAPQSERQQLLAQRRPLLARLGNDGQVPVVIGQHAIADHVGQRQPKPGDHLTVGQHLGGERQLRRKKPDVTVVPVLVVARFLSTPKYTGFVRVPCARPVAAGRSLFCAAHAAPFAARRAMRVVAEALPAATWFSVLGGVAAA
jgi:hypothetical protein